MFIYRHPTTGRVMLPYLICRHSYGFMPTKYSLLYHSAAQMSIVNCFQQNFLPFAQIRHCQNGLFTYFFSVIHHFAPKRRPDCSGDYNARGKGTQFSTIHKPVSHFSFDTAGAKEKLTKDNAVLGVFRTLRSARRALPLHPTNF